jgi:DNA-directed RNA polymerase subunit P
MVDEINSENISDDSTDDIKEDRFDAVYSCLRCGSKLSNEELTRLPEIKCICGFKVFVKLRPPLVKTIDAI